MRRISCRNHMSLNATSGKLLSETNQYILDCCPKYNRARLSSASTYGFICVLDNCNCKLEDVSVQDLPPPSVSILVIRVSATNLGGDPSGCSLKASDKKHQSVHQNNINLWTRNELWVSCVGCNQSAKVTTLRTCSLPKLSLRIKTRLLLLLKYRIACTRACHHLQSIPTREGIEEWERRYTVGASSLQLTFLSHKPTCWKLLIYNS